MASSYRLSVRCAVGIAAVAMFAAAPLFAQPRGRGEGGPRYDPATEATVSGTVESVEQVAGPGGGRGRRGMAGTHLMVKTSAETLHVHLGPAAFLKEQKVTIDKGDTLTLVGSRVTVDGEPVFIVREVRKGDSVWTLRDTAGMPLWRGRRGTP